MNPRSWAEIQSIVIDGRRALTKLLCRGPQSAIFETTDPESDDQPSYFVQLLRAGDAGESEQILKRLEEARFLTHPGILRPQGVGLIDEGTLAFCVTAKPLSVLSQVPGPMPVAEARLLVANLASALAYLHEENLVLGNLRPEGVWKTENGWVLADFSQLRLIGDQAETSPEGQQGAASPAGDVWSLGVLLRRVLTDDTGRKPVRAGLPAPFQRIVRECLEPNPEARASLERVEALLNQADAEETPVWTPRHRREADETSDPRAQRPAIGDFFRTPRLAWVLIAMVGILGVVVWTLALLGKSETPPPPAQIAAAGPEADRIAPPGAAAPTPQAVPSDPAVGELLDKWIATMRAKDLNGQMALYAPLVDTYYKQHRVPKSRVASDRKHEFNAMGPVKKFEATRIHITQLDPSNAVIEFDKNWVAGGNSARSAHSQLTLKKIGGEWKILGERELKTRNS